MHKGDGLIDIHEDFTFLGFKRQTIAGLIQTKYAYIKRDGLIFKGIHVAKEGVIEIAEGLVKGEVAFKSSVTSVWQPAAPDDKPDSSIRVCTVGDKVNPPNLRMV